MRFPGCRCRATLEPTPVPQLEDEEGPQRLAVVSPAGKMLGDESLHLLRLEEPLTTDPLGRQLVLQRFAQLALEPGGDRDPEALLPAVRDTGRQHIAHSLLQQVLRVEPAELES